MKKYGRKCYGQGEERKKRRTKKSRSTHTHNHCGQTEQMKITQKKQGKNKATKVVCTGLVDCWGMCGVKWSKKEKQTASRKNKQKQII